MVGKCNIISTFSGVAVALALTPLVQMAFVPLSAAASNGTPVEVGSQGLFGRTSLLSDNVTTAAYTLPTPVVTSVSSPALNPFDSTNPESNAAVSVSNVFVQQVGNPIYANTYDVCFEFGSYQDIFSTNRSNICVNIPNFNLPPTTTPEFLDSQEIAQRAGDQKTFAPPPKMNLVADGILTALNNQLNNDVRRTQGEFYLDNGMGFIEPLFTTSFDSYLIPYTYDDKGTPGDTSDDEVFSVKGTYNYTNSQWEIDYDNTSTPTDPTMFARFVQTGVIPLEVPESSNVVSLILVGGLLVFTLSRKDSSQ